MNTECEKNIFPRLFAQAAIWLLIAFGIGFAAWTVFFTETGNGDNVEHIHATWLVAYGEVPYRDFFQHHNPLMWYLFAPLVNQAAWRQCLTDFGRGTCHGSQCRIRLSFHRI